MEPSPRSTIQVAKYGLGFVIAETMLIIVGIIGPRFNAIPEVFILRQVATMTLAMLLIWFMAESVGMRTQQDINSRLGRNDAALSSSGLTKD
jgi:hypothetical protein